MLMVWARDFFQLSTQLFANLSGIWTKDGISVEILSFANAGQRVDFMKARLGGEVQLATGAATETVTHPCDVKLPMCCCLGGNRSGA
jgi:hypothetical protein